MSDLKLHIIMITEELDAVEVPEEVVVEEATKKVVVATEEAPNVIPKASSKRTPITIFRRN